jgi:hypothetical protein
VKDTRRPLVLSNALSFNPLVTSGATAVHSELKIHLAIHNPSMRHAGFLSEAHTLRARLCTSPLVIADASQSVTGTATCSFAAVNERTPIQHLERSVTHTSCPCCTRPTPSLAKSGTTPQAAEASGMGKKDI